MSASKKNEAVRLIFEFVFIFLVIVLGDWMFRGRGRSVHQILIDSIPFVLGATTVNVWNQFSKKNASGKTELASKS